MTAGGDNVCTVILVVAIAEVLKLCPRIPSLVSSGVPDIEPENASNSTVIVQECDDCGWTVQWFVTIAFVYHIALFCWGCCCWAGCCQEPVDERRGLRIIQDDGYENDSGF